MPNSRSIPEALWIRARRLLVFYFAHRGMVNAEDLAQDTLTEVLRRDDFEFSRDEDFVRVCYGFATHVLLTARRKESRGSTSELDENFTGATHVSHRMTSAETAVFLNEVMTKGESSLSAADWEAIRSAVSSDAANSTSAEDPATANRLRVRLHRARIRLSRLTGWKE